MQSVHQHDVLIIGSGAAGLTLALQLAQTVSVAVISKRELSEGSTLYAQGGISAVLDAQDTVESHVRDTLKAGGGLCDPKVVRLVVERGPGVIHWLLDQGVRFTRDDSATDAGGYHLTREGGHTHRRVIHAADATGREVETTLEAQVRARPNVTLFEHHIAVDLITAHKLGQANNAALGAYLLDRRSGRVETFLARCVLLATGGANKVYLYTSNPDVSTGDGIAIAWRAGCRIANMEFMQFHPTCLYHPKAKSFLVTEALRGEGARLLLPGRNPLHAALRPARRAGPPRHRRPRHRPRDEAPGQRVRLPGHLPPPAGVRPGALPDHLCPLPGVWHRHHPGAHPGGPRRPLHLWWGPGGHQGPHRHPRALRQRRGRLHRAARGQSHGQQLPTGVPGLQRTGGPGHRGGPAHPHRPCEVPPWDESRVTQADEEVVVSHNWEELRRFMWDYVGIVRTNKRLQRAKRRVDLLRQEIIEYYGTFRVTNDLLELRNLVDVADLIIQCALRRRESRGLHYTLDFPHKDPTQRSPTILIPDPMSRGRGH